MQVRFLGGIERVTGSCTWCRTKDAEFLVDCGMVQGEAHDVAENARPFPFDPRALSFVLLTHAHLDHCGLLPRLYREGFVGRIHCTRATALLCVEILRDAARLDAPFDRDDVDRLSFVEVDARPDFRWGRLRPIANDLFCCFFRSSHILGSASIGVSWNKHVQGKSIWFSGDVGNNTRTDASQPLLKHAHRPQRQYGYLVCESTYGDRPASAPTFDERVAALAAAIEEALLAKRGHLVIPCFSLHRTQELLFDLYYVRNVLWADRPAPDRAFDLVCDSPLGTRISAIYARELARPEPGADADRLYLNRNVAAWLGVADREVEPTMCKVLAPSSEVGSPNDRSLSRNRPSVVLTSAGMCNGGPVLEYLRQTLEDERNTVLLVGYQSRGTNGALLSRLVEPSGEPEGVLELGDESLRLADVRASVRRLAGYSGHADQRKLLDYVVRMEERFGACRVPHVFLNHGTNPQREALREAIGVRCAELRKEHGAEHDFRVEVSLPLRGDGWFDLDAGEWMHERPLESSADRDRTVQLKAEIDRMQAELARLEGSG